MPKISWGSKISRHFDPSKIFLKLLIQYDLHNLFSHAQRTLSCNFQMHPNYVGWRARSVVVVVVV